MEQQVEGNDSKYIKIVEDELKSVVKMVSAHFGDDYAKKNPDLVQHLMDKIQEQKYIEIKAKEN